MSGTLAAGPDFAGPVGMLATDSLTGPRAASVRGARPMSPRRTIGVMGRMLEQQDGLGLYARQLLGELALRDARSRYLIFLDRAPTHGWFDALANVKTHVLRSRSRLLWDQVWVPRAARAFGCDLLFHPKFSLPLVSAIPAVFVLQSCDWYVNPGNYPWWDNIYIRVMLPLYCRKASAVLAISQAVLEELRTRTGIEPAVTGITHAGVGPGFTPRADPVGLQRFAQDYRLPARFILTVARALHGGVNCRREYPGGNNERLIRAYQDYRARATDPLPLVVAGKRIEPYLRARGLGDAELAGVRFLGFVPNERLVAAYQLATCFVLATACESFGLPILEALATGCPAIVPNTCAAPEVAAGAARLIDPSHPADITRALLEVTGSADLRERMRRAGFARARRFGWRRAAERVLAVFDQVLAGEAERATAAVRR